MSNIVVTIGLSDVSVPVEGTDEPVTEKITPDEAAFALHGLAGRIKGQEEVTAALLAEPLRSSGGHPIGTARLEE